MNVTFRELFGADGFATELKFISEVVTKSYGENGASFGYIITDNRHGAWIMNGALTWWTDGTLVVFGIEKIRAPLNSYLAVNGARYTYGFTPEDARLFSRFSPDFDIDFHLVYKEMIQDEVIKKYNPPLPPAQKPRSYQK